MRKPFPNDETPTKPDVIALPCPACRNSLDIPTGKIPKTVTFATTYRITEATCETCLGKLTVSRAIFDRWAAEQK